MGEYRQPEDHDDHRSERSLTVGRSRGSEAGFTLSELIVVVYIIGLLTTMALNNFLEAIERARLARCLVEVHYIQTAIWKSSDIGVSLISPADFWARWRRPATRAGVLSRRQ